MSPRVAESFCEGKFRDERNEDRLFVGSHHFAVIDGSSAAEPFGGRSGGIVAAEIILQVLADLDPQATIDEFEWSARDALSRLAREHGTPSPYAAASVVSLQHQEIWRIGDCPFAIDGHWNIPAHNSHEHAFFRFRQMLAEGYRMNGDDGDLQSRLDLGIASVTRDWLKMTKSWVNADEHPFAFAALDERTAPRRFREVHRLPSNWQRITLASDGAVVSCQGQKGPDGVADMIAQVTRVKSRDPLCLNEFPYWRGFLDGASFLDDATLLSICR